MLATVKEVVDHFELVAYSHSYPLATRSTSSMVVVPVLAFINPSSSIVSMPWALAAAISSLAVAPFRIKFEISLVTSITS